MACSRQEPAPPHSPPPWWEGSQPHPTAPHPCGPHQIPGLPGSLSREELLKRSNPFSLPVVNQGEARSRSQGLPGPTHCSSEPSEAVALGPARGAAGGLRDRRLWSGWLLLWGLRGWPGWRVQVCLGVWWSVPDTRQGLHPRVPALLFCQLGDLTQPWGSAHPCV